MSYSQIAWLPLTGGLMLLGLVASWFAWRRRGIAAGLRGVAWSLLPLAAYLVGVIELLWKFGTAIGDFATSFVFSAKVWAGLAVVALAAVLFVVSGTLRRRGRGKKKKEGSAQQPGALPATRGAPGLPAGDAKPKLAGGKRSAAPPLDDDMKDIQDILRRRGIK